MSLYLPNDTLYTVGERLITLGIKEIPGEVDHPFIQWAFMLCRGFGPETPDEVAWCAAALQVPCVILGLPRSGSAMARSWAHVGIGVRIEDARVGWDIVVLSRPPNPKHGHVGIFGGWSLHGDSVDLVGGNQNNEWCHDDYDRERIVAVRRLREAA